MFDFKLKLENFLSIKRGEVNSKNNITILLAPNRAGKTQILLLLYSIFWSLWKAYKDKDDFSKEKFEKELKKKLQNVFLIKKVDEILSWESKKYSITFSTEFLNFSISGPAFKIEEFSFLKSLYFDKPPVFIQPAGLGDYYKGVYSLKKYYPEWKLVSEAAIDLINDLFIVYAGKTDVKDNNESLLQLYEKLFSAKYFIQNDRIYIQEKGKKYGIERTASGLKSLSWLYLILRYNLFGNFLFIDEPEVNLHPAYIDNLSYFIYELSKDRKIFLATHSDYMLESFNKLINNNDFKVDVFLGKLEDTNAIYKSTEADKDNIIDTSPLIDVYLKILKEGFGYESI
jgi:predicted ATPase